MSEQRAKEWYEIRRGKFTASEISKLLGVKGFGVTGEDYIFKKAIEQIYGLDEDDEESFITKDMQRGIDLEPLAFRKFNEIHFDDFFDVQNAFFFPYGNDAGCSPDGLVNKDSILEIKCPRANKFFKIVAKGKDVIDSNYYDQMQFQMLCTNSIKCYFFNYIIKDGVEMWHEIVIERDEKRIDFIKERLEKAIKLKYEYMSYILENKQF